MQEKQVQDPSILRSFFFGGYKYAHHAASMPLQESRC